jgi:hypothetical protein
VRKCSRRNGAGQVAGWTTGDRAYDLQVLDLGAMEPAEDRPDDAVTTLGRPVIFTDGADRGPAG